MSRMPSRHRLPARTARRWLMLGTLAMAAGLFASHSSEAQVRRVTVKPPEITRVEVKGTEAVDKKELLQNLAIVPSRCANILLTPFCWVSHSSVFYRKSTLDEDELARDVLRARVFYYQRGYRQTAVDTIVQRNKDQTVHITFLVTEGEPVIVSDINIVQPTATGRIQALGRRDIGRALLLEQGEPLNLLELDSTRARLRERMQDRGYTDATVDTLISYDAAKKRASVTLQTNPRWRSHVNSIEIQGLENLERSTILQSLLFKEGELLRRVDVINSQRSLYESGLFRRAAILIPERQDSLKHVVIAIQEAPPRETRLSTGFNTVDFVQAEARYTNFNWLGGARRLTMQGTVGNLFARGLNGRGIFYDVGNVVVGGTQAKYFAPTFTASIETRKPWFLSPANEGALGIFAHRRSSPGIYVDQGYGASATFTRFLTRKAPLSLNYRFEITKVDAGDVYFCVNYGVCDNGTLNALHRSQKMSPLALSLSLDRTDDPFTPRSGTRGQIDAEVATQWTLSDFRYGRIAIEGSAFLPVRRSSTIGTHVRVGFVNAYRTPTLSDGSGGSILHPRKRFYTGGSQSVRGFAESQLGPRVLTIPESKLRADSIGCPASITNIADCDPDAGVLNDRDFDPRPLGGNVLVEASVEFRFPIITDLTGAVFIDGAYLAQRTDPALPKSKTAATPGFGVRYNSPAGPIRVDVGINPITTEKLTVVTETTGTDGSRQLVTLPIKRTYAPAKAGFSGFLSRLTLHLSIGEAF